MRVRVATLIFAGVASLALSSVGFAQDANKPSKAPKPAAPSGPAPVHDLSGVWNLHAAGAQRRFLGATYTQDPPDMTAWATEKYNSEKPSNGPRTHSLKETDDPVLKLCLPPGTPRIYLQPFPFQIVQTPTEIFMLFEYDHTIRQIFMDGRPHPKPEDLTPTYMGHSIGKWEDDTTLVVDTVGFNENTWLDRDGHPHSDQLHVIERFHRVDRDNMTLDITMEDSKALAKPWVSTQMPFQLHPDWNIEELACTDNAAFENFEK